MTRLWAIVALCVASAAAVAAAYDCADICPSPENSYRVDLSKVRQPIFISRLDETPPSTTETEVTLDLCRSLPANRTLPRDEQCAPGTLVCTRRSNRRAGTARVEQVISSAATGPGGAISGKVSEYEHDVRAGKETFFLELEGKPWAGRSQRTKVRFECDPRAGDGMPIVSEYDMSAGILQLRWVTALACSQQSNVPRPGAPAREKRGIGFFSVFFTVAVVAFVAYMIVGMWNNYTQYGATGWDMVPHRDFWRESPYIARDAALHVFRSVSHAASPRGGYEPV